MKIQIFLSILLGIIVGFNVRNVQAQCATPPSCSSMGYTLSSVKGPGWDCTACPFDGTTWACSAKPCPIGSSTDNSPWGSYMNGPTQVTGRWVNCIIAYSGDKPCYSNQKIDIPNSASLTGTAMYKKFSEVCGGRFAELNND